MSEKSRFGVDYSVPAARLARDQERNALELLLRLRRERERLGLSQTEVARRMGRNQSVVSNLERLGADPRWSSIRRYATALGVEITYHFESEDDRRLDALLANQSSDGDEGMDDVEALKMARGHGRRCFPLCVNCSCSTCRLHAPTSQTRLTGASGSPSSTLPERSSW